MDSHPPRNSIDDSFLREIRIGLAVVAILLLIFAWVAWLKYSGRLAIGPQSPAVAAHSEQSSRPDSSSPTPSALLNSSVQSNRLRESQSLTVEVAEQPAVSPLLPGTSGGASVSVEAPVTNAMPRLEESRSQASASPPQAPDLQPETLFSGGSFRPDAASPIRPSTLPPSRQAETVADDSAIPFREPPAMAVEDKEDGQAEPVSPASFMSDTEESALPDSRVIPLMPPLRAESKSEEPAEGNDTGDHSVIPGGPPESGNVIQSMVHPRAISGSNDLESHRVTAPGLRPSRAASSILVQQGDSFWQIAQRVYGDSRYYKALHAANLKQFPSIEHVAPGSRVAIPEIDDLQKAFPDLCPDPESELVEPGSAGVTYVTKEGDTLFGIARDQLGQASRYIEIWHLNHRRLPEGTSHESVLESGTELVLPAPIR